MAAQNVNTFLKTFRVQKGHPISHTSIAGGAFYLPRDAYENFLKYYKLAFASQGIIPLHLTETHRPTSPLLVDLDFRQTTSDRKYTINFITNFLYEYSKYVFHHVNGIKNIEYYILEKGIAPRQDLKKKTELVFKDGVHIIAPYLVTQPEIQESIRDMFINDHIDFFAPLGLSNPIDDIIDEAVIRRNNWLMYGSNKPCESDRFLVTNKIIATSDSEIHVESINDPWDESLIELLSIRDPSRNECRYTDFGEEQLKRRKCRAKDKDEEAFKMSSVSRQNTITCFDMNVLDDIEIAIRLIDILKPERADKYDSWINLGLCLHNIDPNGVELLEKWIEFSRMSSKFVDGECEEKWDAMQVMPRGLGMGTLRMWAKQDDPAQYSKIMQNNMLYLVNKCVSGTHTDIANVVFHMFGNVFKCVSIKQSVWYEFKYHRWHIIEQAYTLRQLISTEIFRLFTSMAEFLQKQANACRDEDSGKYLDKANIFNSIAKKLKTSGFKDAIVKECAELCFDPNFMELLDSNPNIIAFENGVYDLKTMRFRDGLPEDYVSFTTGYNFVDVVNVHIRQHIMHFFNSIMINEANVNYLLSICAYFLNGDKYMENFWFFTGRGRNGKGTLCMLLAKTFGAYYYEPDISLVTTVKKNSSSANPELAKAKGKRIMCASEPDDEDSSSKFRVNKLKQLRGNDLLQARGLFKDFVEFRPQFGMVFQMNDIPELSKADDAIGKTLKIVNFPYQFVNDVKQEHERKADPNLKALFDQDIRYRQQFMLLLLDYYSKYVHGRKEIVEPDEVVLASQEYMEENNPVAVWLKDNYCITYQTTDKITVDDLYEDFTNTSRTKITKKKFGTCMGLINFKSTVGPGNKRVYTGLKRMIIDEVDELDD